MAGASRPLVDDGWVDASRQVGLTGASRAPRSTSPWASRARASTWPAARPRRRSSPSTATATPRSSSTRAMASSAIAGDPAGADPRGARARANPNLQAGERFDEPACSVIEGLFSETAKVRACWARAARRVRRRTSRSRRCVTTRPATRAASKTRHSSARPALQLRGPELSPPRPRSTTSPTSRTRSHDRPGRRAARARPDRDPRLLEAARRHAGRADRGPSLPRRRGARRRDVAVRPC